MKPLRIWGCWNGITAGVIMNLRTPGLPRWHSPLMRIAPSSADRIQKSFCVLWKCQQSKNSDISWDTRFTFQVSKEWPLLQIPFHLLKQAAATCMRLLNDPFLFGTNTTPSIRETNQSLNSVLKKNASVWEPFGPGSACRVCQLIWISCPDLVFPPPVLNIYSYAAQHSEHVLLFTIRSAATKPVFSFHYLFCSFYFSGTDGLFPSLWGVEEVGSIHVTSVDWEQKRNDWQTAFAQALPLSTSHHASHGFMLFYFSSLKRAHLLPHLLLF